MNGHERRVPRRGRRKRVVGIGASKRSVEHTWKENLEERVMNSLKILPLTTLLLGALGCNHPIEILGNGDVLSATGARTCYREEARAGKQNCTNNTVIGAYQETYYAVPRAGWEFETWLNYCVNAIDNACSFEIPASSVAEFWGATVPPLIARFVPNLTGSYSGWLDTQNSNCIDPDDNGTYRLAFHLNIGSQIGADFSGTAVGTLVFNGITYREDISLSGVIAYDGSIQGTSSHSVEGSGGQGTFTGELNGNMISFIGVGRDIYGDTCRYSSWVSAERI